jgi:hypothetical protein
LLRASERVGLVAAGFQYRKENACISPLTKIFADRLNRLNFIGFRPLRTARSAVKFRQRRRVHRTAEQILEKL